ncbi:MAG: helix-turn-helix transcriptional regulator [Prevotella ruminicola]|uniref:Helix-turn-helix transcriptional regulator n=1 Tax=Xylanibacter ruminicola TaxID=839 RepID=A0A9D5S930_XYLRU|nr:helix-turn-helix transcriptional regulator [Xylanibacter ruminicola]
MRHFLYLILLCATALLSCGSPSCNRDFNPSAIDSILSTVHDTVTIYRMVDSLKTEGVIGDITGDFYLACVMYHHNPKHAVTIIDSALACKLETEQDRFYRFMVQGLSIEVDVANKHYDLALRKGQRHISDADKDYVNSHEMLLSSFVQTLSNMAQCSIFLERYDTAEEYLKRAIDLIDGYVSDSGHSNESLKTLKTYRLKTAVDAMIAYCNMFQYERGGAWMVYLEQTLNDLAKHPEQMDVNHPYIQLQLLAIKPVLLEMEGRRDEAAKAYEEYQKNPLYKTPVGRANAVPYLNKAHRFDEAVANSEEIEPLLHRRGMQYNIENLQGFVKMRFEAFLGAGQRDSALAVATRMIAALDSAKLWERRDKSMELAVIYQTHEKELALEESRAETRVHRILLIGTILIILLIAYLLRRSYKYNKVLTEKNRKLYEEIEQHRQEQQQEMAQLQATPEAELTTEQLLYRRLCTLMDEQQPYTDENLNRDTLASLLGTNEKYVAQAIRECSHGETVTDFINHYRLEHVARLLKSTDDPIAIIGELSGIPSRATLARLFRNAYGMTPTEYRKI